MLVKVLDRETARSTVYDTAPDREVAYGVTIVDIPDGGIFYAEHWEEAFEVMHDAQYSLFGEFASETVVEADHNTVVVCYVIFFDTSYEVNCVVVPSTQRWNVYLMNENGKTIERI